MSDQDNEQQERLFLLTFERIEEFDPLALLTEQPLLLFVVLVLHWPTTPIANLASARSR
ncbi:MAG: hypothetical protein AAFX99_23020 [Myxococcota bacterium]